jgi:hypothetical protein
MDDFVVLELFDGVAKLGAVGPAIVPDVELQQVDGVDAEGVADPVGVGEDVIGGENVVVVVGG